MEGLTTLSSPMDDTLLERFQQTYRNLDLFPLVEPEDIERFRVDYGLDVLARLKTEINASEKNGKLIFTGHRGCGKSTLLKRLAIEMQEKHFPVFFSIADLIEMSGITHVNILYAIALKLLSQASKQQIPVAEDIKTTILGWTTTERTQVSSQETKGEVSAGIEGVLNLFSLKLQQEKSFRDELETTFAKRISDLVSKIDRLAAAIQTTVKKPILVIIDDLDKLDLGLVESIYENNIKALFSPQIRIVFTIPIAALRVPSVEGNLKSEGIGRVHRLPASKFFAKEDFRNPQAQPNQNVDKLVGLLMRRIPEDLVEPETARQIVLKSGGVVRELVRIARECCTECMVLVESEPDRTSFKIDTEILTAALRNLRNDFAMLLGENRYQVLVQVYENFEPADAASQDFLDLLHSLYVLQYLNDDLWFDVHPIVVDLLKRRNLVA